MNFKTNQKEKHSQLRQCQTCGKFWLREKRRGRSQIFCDPKCEKLFNRLPKDKKKEVMAAWRKEAREKEKEKECREITKLLLKSGDYTEKAAAKEAKDWIEQGKTLNQFKKDL